MPNYGSVETVDDLARLVDRVLASGQPFAFDTETGYHGDDAPHASLTPERGFIAGFSFSGDPSWGRYLPLGHDYIPNVSAVQAAPHLWRLLSSGRGVAHNAKFDLRHLASFFRQHLPADAQVQASDGYFPVFSDTLLEAYVCAEWKHLGLKDLTKAVFGHDQTALASLFPPMTHHQRKCQRFNVLPLSPEVVAYTAEDAAWCLRLHQRLHPRVCGELIYKIEMAVLPVLCRMEDRGLRYDWAAMAKRATEVESFLAEMGVEVLADLSAALGQKVVINLASSAQVSRVLFSAPPHGLGLATTRMTKGGNMSTDAIALEGLAQTHPIARRLVEWRECTKLLSTYLQKYEADYGWCDCGRTHPNIMQSAVGSGRFAVAHPPYQQSPKTYHFELASGRTLDLNFRDFIVPEPGHYFLGFDYSQVELRVLAGESGEPALLEAFERGEDVHRKTAAMMFGVPQDQVSSELRARGKTLNFALLYQMGVKGLADRMTITKTEAKKLYDQYFAAFSCIRVWTQRQVREAGESGYVTSRFKRRTRIWELESGERGTQAKGQRLSVNAPIQGGAADYMKAAMARCDRDLRKAGLADRVHLVMNVHDALVFEVPNDIPPVEVVRVVQPAVCFRVPGWPRIEADWSAGDSWGTMTKIDVTEEGEITSMGFRPKLVALPGLSEGSSTGNGVGGSTSGPDGVTVPSVNGGPQPSLRVVGGTQARSVPELLGARRLEVRLTDRLPDAHQFARWLQLLKERPGPHIVLLFAPDGTEIDMSGSTTSLTPEDAASISMVFGAAEVGWSADSVDPGVVMAGLVL